MNGVERIDGIIDRNRTLELSYSLYECLTDFIQDMDSLEYCSEDDIEGIIERLSISAMNCLADMRLLLDPFDTLVRYRWELMG